MTRQKVTDGPREVMTRKCPTCGGDGIVVSDATIALGVERRLRALAAAGAGSRIQGYRVAVHPKTLALLAGPGGSRLAALEEATRRRFYLVPAEGHVHADHLEVLAEGRNTDLAPAAPVEVGAERELKLVEVDRHDGTAAVGRLDGYDVVVAGAAKLVGKKATVQVGLVLDGQAFASLVDAAPSIAPITFESEAEKPTRAPSRRKADAEAEAPEAPVEVELAEEAEEPEAAEETVGEAEEEAAAATTRKRTRRGSRGGKRRRKPATAAEAADAVSTTDGAAAAEPEPDGEMGSPSAAPRSRRRQPKIHVPAETGETPSGDGSPVGLATEPEAQQAAEPADEETSTPEAVDGVAPKKRTRRGTRGGRNRKKKPAATNGAAEPAADGEGAAVPAETSADGGEPEYVPMSEWIEDFDRRQ
jgi:ribonuclease G